MTLDDIFQKSITEKMTEYAQIAVGGGLLGIFFGSAIAANGIAKGAKYLSDKAEYYRTKAFVDRHLNRGLIDPADALYGFKNATETKNAFDGTVQAFYLPPNKEALLGEIADSKDRKEAMKAVHRINDPFTYNLRMGDPVNHYHVVVLERIGDPKHMRFHVSERLGPEDFCIDVLFFKHYKRIVECELKTKPGLAMRSKEIGYMPR